MSAADKPPLRLRDAASDFRQPSVNGTGAVKPSRHVTMTR